MLKILFKPEKFSQASYAILTILLSFFLNRVLSHIRLLGESFVKTKMIIMTDVLLFIIDTFILL